jgi:hypothetical protein
MNFILLFSLFANADENTVNLSGTNLTLVYANTELSGSFSTLQNGCLALNTFNGLRYVPTAIIEEITISDQILKGSAATEWLQLAEIHVQEKYRILDKQYQASQKAKWISALSPSAGTARMSLIDDKITPAELVGTTILDGLLLGGTAYGIWGAERWGVVIPFGVSVVAYRFWAVKNVQIGYSTSYDRFHLTSNGCALN